MSAPARSLFWFGCYMLGVGISMLLAPNLVLTTVGLPADNDIWVHVVGLLALYIGIYDIAIARGELLAGIRLSVYMRGVVPLLFGGFVLMGIAQWPLILFGIVDLVGAAWTAVALSRDYRPATT